MCVIRYHLFIHTFLIALKISVMEPRQHMEIKSYKVCLAVQINLFQSSIIKGAMLEAAKQSRLGSRDLGFKLVLFLSDCRRAAQVVNNSQITSSWQEKSLMSDSDWSHLLDADFVYHSVFCPKSCS